MKLENAGGERESNIKQDYISILIFFKCESDMCIGYNIMQSFKEQELVKNDWIIWLWANY